MNMKMKALVAVTALAIGSQAQAAIYDDNAGSPTTGTGVGELFLSVVDRGAAVPRSYIRDLGITANQFRANPTAALSFTADANLIDILTNKSGSIYWNIAGMSNTAGPSFPDTVTQDYGYLTTTTAQLSSGVNIPAGFGGISGAGTKISSYLQAANFPDVNYAVNDSKIITDTSSLAYYDRPGAWGDTWSGAHSTEATQNTSMDFWFVGMDYATDPETNTSYAQKFTGTWTMATNGNLNYTAAAVPPPAIPVPAAVWLLGSALVGLVGVARRKSEQVKA